MGERRDRDRDRGRGRRVASSRGPAKRSAATLGRCRRRRRVTRYAASSCRYTFRRLSSHRAEPYARLSVRPSVCLPVCPSVRPYATIVAVAILPVVRALAALVAVAAATRAGAAADEDDEYQWPPRYDDAAASLFVHGAQHRAAANRVPLPPPPPPLPATVRLFAAADDYDVPSPLNDQRFAGTPLAVASRGLTRHRLDRNGDGSDSHDDDDRDRFERARTLMRVEYERISALDALYATTSDQLFAPPPPTTAPVVEPQATPFIGHPNAAAAASNVSNVSTTATPSGTGTGAAIGAATADQRQSPVASGWAGETLFVCGAAVFLLTMTGAAVGVANRRRSNRQSYPCWERELRNGLASPRAL